MIRKDKVEQYFLDMVLGLETSEHESEGEDMTTIDGERVDNKTPGTEVATYTKRPKLTQLEITQLAAWMMNKNATREAGEPFKLFELVKESAEVIGREATVEAMRQVCDGLNICYRTRDGSNDPPAGDVAALATRVLELERSRSQVKPAQLERVRKQAEKTRAGVEVNRQFSHQLNIAMGERTGKIEKTLEEGLEEARAALDSLSAKIDQTAPPAEQTLVRFERKFAKQRRTIERRLEDVEQGLAGEGTRLDELEEARKVEADIVKISAEIRRQVKICNDLRLSLGKLPVEIRDQAAHHEERVNMTLMEIANTITGLRGEVADLRAWRGELDDQIDKLVDLHSGNKQAASSLIAQMHVTRRLTFALGLMVRLFGQGVVLRRTASGAGVSEGADVAPKDQLKIENYRVEIGQLVDSRIDFDELNKPTRPQSIHKRPAGGVENIGPPRQVKNRVPAPSPTKTKLKQLPPWERWHNP